MTAKYVVAQGFPTAPLAVPSPSKTVSGTSTAGQNSPIPLGTRVKCTNGQEMLWVQASAAISTTVNEPFALCVDPSFQAAKATQALIKLGQQIAVAPPIVIAQYDFFWAVVEGSHVPLRVSASTKSATPLYSTTVAGRLDSTSGGSHVCVLGIKTVTSASTSASIGSTIRECIITNPIATTAFVR